MQIVFDFYFSSYGYFCTKNCQFSVNFHDNSKKKIGKLGGAFLHWRHFVIGGICAKGLIVGEHLS